SPATTAATRPPAAPLNNTLRLERGAISTFPPKAFVRVCCRLVRVHGAYKPMFNGSAGDAHRRALTRPKTSPRPCRGTSRDALASCDPCRIARDSRACVPVAQLKRINRLRKRSGGVAGEEGSHDANRLGEPDRGGAGGRRGGASNR